MLSPNFALHQEWEDRQKYLEGQRIGSDAYEWISLVQKKFSSSGKASAIDLDVACLLANSSDQIKDLLDICYKFRHTDEAMHLFPSTEYAIFRLFLDANDIDGFLKVINDPLNYGIFPNEHISSLYLNHFSRINDTHAAARVACYVMQQELFSYPLLNYLCVRALLQFLECRKTSELQENNEEIVANSLSEFDERVLPRRPLTLEDEINFSEENVKIFRYPWLKVPYSDGHFDLDRTDLLVGKSLEWLSWNLKLAEDDSKSQDRNACLNESVNLLGILLQGKCVDTLEALDQLYNTVSQSSGEYHDIFRGMFQIARPFLAAKAHDTNEINNDQEQKEFGAIPTEEWQQILKRFDDVMAEMVEQKDIAADQNSPKLWKLLQDAFQPIQTVEEKHMVDQQRLLFVEWQKSRNESIENQARRLELDLRLKEISKRRKELSNEKELLFFFENRHKWEDKAHQRQLLEEELGLLKKKGKLTEEEYAKTLFQMSKMIQEGSTAAKALEILQPGATGVASTKGGGNRSS